MTRQLADTAEAVIEPRAMPVAPNSGARLVHSHRGAEAVPRAADPDRRSGIHECCHYWVIEYAVLPMSKGVCRMCGEVRVFRNQIKWAEIAPAKAAIYSRRLLPSDEQGKLEKRRAASLVLRRSNCEEPLAV